MGDTLEPLIADLVIWCAVTRRKYEDVLDAWRTSCPRLMVWEEARALGYVETRMDTDGLIINVTPKGHALVAAALMRRTTAIKAPAIAKPG